MIFSSLNPTLVASSSFINMGYLFFHVTDEHWPVILLVILVQFTTDSTSVNNANFTDCFAIGSEALLLLVQTDENGI